MRDSFDHNFSDRINYRIVIVTLDSHNARPCERALLNMLPDFDGLHICLLYTSPSPRDS